MKGFALGLALKQRQKGTRKSPIWGLFLQISLLESRHCKRDSSL